jgi:hypothetical protein
MFKVVIDVTPEAMKIIINDSETRKQLSEKGLKRENQWGKSLCIARFPEKIKKRYSNSTK